MDESGKLHSIFTKEELSEREEALAPLMKKLAEEERKANPLLATQLVQADGSPVPDHWTLFATGEVVEVKGCSFRIAYMNTETVILEPVKLTIKVDPER